MVSSGSRSAPPSPRVLGLLGREYANAVDYYRIVSPYEVMGDWGYQADFMPYTTARRLATEGRLNPGQYDLFVLSRAAIVPEDARILKLIAMLKQAGKKVIYETDDDYTNVHRKATEGDAIPVLAACDAATTTTPHLAKILRQHNDHVFVLPNALNFDIWDTVERGPKEQVTIALAGTGTHFEDWRLVQDALYRLAEQEAMQFLILGYKPHYLEDLPKMHFINPLPYPAYAKALGQVDIGLCPLVPDDEFNLAKSAVKALEFMAAGAAVVAQDMSVYRRVVANKSNGLLADTPGAWYEKVNLLVNDARLRHKLARSGRRWVRKHRNIRSVARYWRRAYEEVYQL